MGIFDRFRRSELEPKAPAPRYRCGDVITVPLGSQRVLLHRRGGGRPPRIVAEFAADALRRCAAWSTIEGHAEAQAQDADGIAALRAELEGLAAEGFLITEPAEAIAVPPIRRIERVGMITQSRDACARRCVASIVSAAERFDRRIDLTIADDDRLGDRGVRIPALAPRSSKLVDLRYAGRPEKRAYLARLAAESRVDPAILDYAFFGAGGIGYTAGANHNALLLDAVGERLVTVDDDTCGRVTRVPGLQDPGPELRSGAETTMLWLYPDVDSAIAEAELEDLDPIALHESALGASLAEALARAAGPRPVRVDRASPRLHAELLEPEAKIGITSIGLCGDSGMSSPFYYLFLEGEAQARLFERYERLRDTRALVRASAGLLVTDGHHLMTPHTGYDLGAIVPPYHPIGRNADGVLGTMLRIVSPQRYIAHLPWAVEHRPEARGYAPQALREGATRLGIGDVIIACVQACVFGPGVVTPEARLAFLGAHLIAIGRLPAPELDEWLRIRRYQQLARTLAALAKLLQSGRGPSAYLQDVEGCIEAVEGALLAPELARPADLPAATAGTLVPELIRRYGELLVAWPEIWRAAERLAASGVRVSAQVDSDL